MAMKTEKRKRLTANTLLVLLEKVVGWAERGEDVSRKVLEDPFVPCIMVAFIDLLSKCSPSTHQGPGTVEGAGNTVRNKIVKIPGHTLKK